jgi:hypothetical protein
MVFIPKKTVIKPYTEADVRDTAQARHLLDVQNLLKELEFN